MEENGKQHRMQFQLVQQELMFFQEPMMLFVRIQAGIM